MAVTLTKNWQNIANGSFVPGSGLNVTFWLDAKYSTQDIANNKTTIQTRLNCTVNSGYGNGYNYSFSCSYAPTVSGSGLWTLSTETITSGESTITHNSDGKKSLTLSASANISGIGMYVSMSGDVILPTIPRDFSQQPSITKGTTTPNSVVINWTTSETCDLVKYKLNSGSWVQIWTGSATSGSFTIPNLTFDTTYTITGNFRRKDSQRSMDSNSLSVKTNARPIQIRVNGQWKQAIPYVRVNGQWKKAQAYIRANNTWKEGI